MSRKTAAALKMFVIDREFDLATPGAFADIRVQPPGQQPYFVEVKFGYSGETLLRHLRRKYGPQTAAVGGRDLSAAVRVIVVVGPGDADWTSQEAELRRTLSAEIQLEAWDEPRLLTMMRELFGIEFQAITAESLVDLRQAIDRAKGFIAFGGTSLHERRIDRVQTSGGLHIAMALGDLQIVPSAHSAECTSARLATASTLRLDS